MLKAKKTKLLELLPALDSITSSRMIMMDEYLRNEGYVSYIIILIMMNLNYPEFQT